MTSKTMIMKFLNFLFGLMLLTGMAVGQQVERELVLVEIGTGTW